MDFENFVEAEYIQKRKNKIGNYKNEIEFCDIYDLNVGGYICCMRIYFLLI